MGISAYSAVSAVSGKIARRFFRSFPDSNHGFAGGVRGVRKTGNVRIGGKAVFLCNFTGRSSIAISETHICAGF
jgi:hypothetical protein